ncbi:MAG: hypothetical protein V3572_13440, partial [Desulfolutivibrio sp.]
GHGGAGRAPGRFRLCLQTPRRYGADAPRGPVSAPTRTASPPPSPEAAPPRRPDGDSGPPEGLESPPAFEDGPPPYDDEPPADARATYDEAALPPIRDGAEAMAGAAVSSGPKGPPTWEGFLRYYDTARKGGLGIIPGLRQAGGRFAPDLGPAGTLVVACGNEFNREQLKSPDALRKLTQVASDYFGPGAAVSVEEPGGEARPGNGELKAYVLERPEVRRAMADFGAEVIGVMPRG